MRFLFTTHPGFGHFNPMIPLGQALQAAGREVAVATAQSFKARVERAGFKHFRAGLEWDESNFEATVPEIRVVPRREQATWTVNQIFLDRSPREMVPDLQAVANLWSPDVVVANNYEVGGVLAAELLGLPYATCNISFRWSRTFLKVVFRRQLARLRREHNLPPDPDFSAYGRYLDLCLMPESWTLGRALAQPWFARLVAGKLFGLADAQRRVALKAAAMMAVLGLDDARQTRARQRAPNHRELFVRPGGTSQSRANPPAWLAQLPNRPIVYVSLGTVFNSIYPEVFATIIEGLRDQPVNVIVTLGANGNPARFGPQPPNIRIERYIPQAEILPYVDVCLNHGGYGTVMEPLLHGIPLVILPLSADQPILAQLSLAHGAAVPLPVELFDLTPDGLPIVVPERLTPWMVRDAVRQALGMTRFRRGAQALQARLAALPGIDMAVERLEQLAMAPEREPIFHASHAGSATRIMDVHRPLTPDSKAI